jgi:predicted negative regulator of RcsB-dependent stress response
MAKKNKVQEPTNVFESPESLQEKLEKSQDFISQNKNIVTGVLTILVLVVGGVFWYNWYGQRQTNTALEQIFPAQFYFEQDSLSKALDGDGNFTDGFLKINSEYGRTKPGKLAGFYAGAIYMKQGQYDQAIAFLKQVDTDDLLIQARAYSLIGDAYMEKGDFKEAASFYQRAANHKPNEEFTPLYLWKLYLAYEKNNDLEAGKKTLTRLSEEYELSPEGRNAKKYLSYLEGLSGQ